MDLGSFIRDLSLEGLATFQVAKDITRARDLGGLIYCFTLPHSQVPLCGTFTSLHP